MSFTAYMYTWLRQQVDSKVTHIAVCNAVGTELARYAVSDSTHVNKYNPAADGDTILGYKVTVTGSDLGFSGTNITLGSYKLYDAASGGNILDSGNFSNQPVISSVDDSVIITIDISSPL